jgi:hypothetical protein
VGAVVRLGLIWFRNPQGLEAFPIPRSMRGYVSRRTPRIPIPRSMRGFALGPHTQI